MILDRVTISGADDRNQVGNLLDFSRHYPFVEWGILFSRKRVGTNRYPSLEWLATLAQFQDRMNLSAHICGSWMRDLLIGLDSFSDLLHGFKRIQINLGAKVHVCNQVLFRDSLKKLRDIGIEEFIVQINGDFGEDVFEIIADTSLPCVKFFDCSGGLGIRPTSWPFSTLPCGFGGGIDHNNVDEVITEIATANSHNVRTWIDTESGVRIDDELNFAKVDQLLMAAANWILKPTEPFIK